VNANGAQPDRQRSLICFFSAILSKRIRISLKASFSFMKRAGTYTHAKRPASARFGPGLGTFRKAYPCRVEDLMQNFDEDQPWPRPCSTIQAKHLVQNVVDATSE
jgi:hypothetical protein